MSYLCMKKISREITTEYLSFVILDHQILPLNVDWMADYIEAMPPFYHEIFG